MDRKPLIALILVGIAPTISVVTGFGIEPGLIAVIVFFLTKFWLLALPAWWRKKVDEAPFSLSIPNNGGWGVATGFGVAILFVIVITYLLLGDLLVSNM